MKILITGGAGFLGRRIHRFLENTEHEISILAMEGEDTTGLDQVIRGDITKPEKLVLPRIDCIIHCAGILESSHPPEELMYKVNHEGTINVFRKGSQSGMKKFIFISTISAMGPKGSRDRPMTEEMEPSPEDAYGRSKLKAEKDLITLSSDTGINVTILRPSVLYGPGMNLNSSGMKIFTSVRNGIMPLVGKGKTTLNMLYVDNLVKAVMASIDRDGISRVYHICENPYTQKEVIDTIANKMGKKGYKKTPKTLLFLLTFLFESISPLLNGPPPLSWTKYHGLTSDVWTMSNERMKQELDLNPLISLNEGVSRTCDHYGW